MPTLEETRALAAGLTFNLSVFRQTLANMIDPRRDYNHECGYPDEITPWEYHNMYERESMAKKVVDVWPNESWKLLPSIYEDEEMEETEWERAFQELEDRHHLFHYLRLIDRVSGIGSFGVMLLGLDDGNDMMLPAEGIEKDGSPSSSVGKHELSFIRCFDESVVKVSAREQDITNPRYSYPTYYVLQFREEGVHGMPVEIISRTVHWTRIVHIADNRLMSEIYGLPRMQPVFNRLCDLRKLLCGSAEMFWKGAFPGFSFEMNPDMKDAEMDTKTIKEEMDAYQNGLQRYLAVQGLTAKSLAPQVADPKGHIEAQMEQIAVTLDVPKRILFGSEEAKLASTQDARAWNMRVKARQDTYLNPLVLRPVIDRLIMLGVLPMTKEQTPRGDPVYLIDWPDLNTPSDQDSAATAAQQTQAMASYVGGNVQQIMPLEHFFHMIMGFDKEETKTLVDAANNQAMLMNPNGPEQLEGDEANSDQEVSDQQVANPDDSLSSDSGMSTTTQQKQQMQDYATMFGSPSPGGWGGPGGGMAMGFSPGMVTPSQTDVAAMTKTLKKKQKGAKYGQGGYMKDGAGLASNHGTKEGYKKGIKRIVKKTNLANGYAQIESKRAQAAERLAASTGHPDMAYLAHRQHLAAAQAHKDAGNDNEADQHTKRASSLLKAHQSLSEQDERENETPVQKKAGKEAVKKANKNLPKKDEDVTKNTNVNLEKRAIYLENKYGERIYKEFIRHSSCITTNEIKDKEGGITIQKQKKYSSGQVQAAVVTILANQDVDAVELLKRRYQFSDESANHLVQVTNQILEDYNDED